MDPDQVNQMSGQGAGIVGAIISLIYLVVLVLVVAGMWKTFAKAGEPGWAAIVPIYNLIVLVKISGKPMWWVVMFFIPCLNFVALIVTGLGVAKNFGKSEGFGIGLGLLSFIFYPILGFSDAQFVGQKTA